MRGILLVLFCSASVYGQSYPADNAAERENPTQPYSDISERIGNFSIELLFHTSKQYNGGNLIISPISVWTVLAVISGGAHGKTAAQLHNALRITKKNTDLLRSSYQNLNKKLQVNSLTVTFVNINAVFVDQNTLILNDFQTVAESVYETPVVLLDFNDRVNTANAINQLVSDATRGRKLVHSSYIDKGIIATSALHFKGQWKVPFNAASTAIMPFYSSTGEQIGEVNMMHSRFTYPFANMKELQARVIELPYGKEDRFSMLIMLPHPNVSLVSMFRNLARVTLDTIINQLRVYKKEYGEDDVECYLPRFRIESTLDLANVLKSGMGIEDVFDENVARLPLLARTPSFVSKVIHRAEIEVTEEGTTPKWIAGDSSHHVGAVSFVGNRPFYFLVIEKVTMSIIFGGVYETPSLY
ncbi:serine protease inhibitor 77Ba-like [Pectinophora gossypiella]|uniref:serine protease inhibitor 77Ba-like n=1 Tax=Pectinophora gossypiella TaxID=13191 RepID=UPI00214F38B9|nr:serine protease inhibitor 77Ba-like [Pectinophora gossypiella]